MTSEGAAVGSIKLAVAVTYCWVVKLAVTYCQQQITAGLCEVGSIKLLPAIDTGALVNTLLMSHEDIALHDMGTFQKMLINPNQR